MHFKIWKDWFEFNRKHFGQIDWQDFKRLTEAETKEIAESIRQFQKGEQSEGKHLFKYARVMNDPDYTAAIVLFIKEEQTHARVLGKYLEIQGIEKLKHHWVDTVFRGMRRLAGLRLTLTVLLTAEIVAAVYYQALGKATDDPLLAALCNQILRDEDRHIEFQCDAIRTCNERSGYLVRLFYLIFHRVLMSGTLLIVWMGHGKVYRRAAYSFLRFWKESNRIFSICQKNISNPKPASGIRSPDSQSLLLKITPGQ